MKQIVQKLRRVWVRILFWFLKPSKNHIEVLENSSPKNKVLEKIQVTHPIVVEDLGIVIRDYSTGMNRRKKVAKNVQRIGKNKALAHFQKVHVKTPEGNIKLIYNAIELSHNGSRLTGGYKGYLKVGDPIKI